MIFNLVFGIIPDIIYFVLFIILIKQIENKKILFFTLFSLCYIPIIIIFQKNIFANIVFTFLIYFIMKLLYKEKANIMDIFIFTWASIIYIFVITVTFCIFKDLVITSIVGKSLLILFLFIFRNKLNKLYNKCILLWDRHNYKKQLKSITIRNINIILLNISIYAMYTITLLLNK